ncbi:unnamed protein product [Didymodactylos carnosus]|uniref:Leucine-rich repeat protein n=1 Tax=Didymodactylos carnosus TaxID=1234261 RepID=A0A8S2F2J8_9BILA|nr:unnamed protein product [Didymodactylos carnosus]CAF4147241.1 unnamed protein product [Didymodactylos carnosus]
MTSKRPTASKKQFFYRHDNATDASWAIRNRTGNIAEELEHNLHYGILHLPYTDLSAKQITEIAHALKVNTTTLITLDISNNNISNEGAISIGDALKVNKTLTRLDIENNHILNEGATSIGDALKVNNTLTTLFISNNNISNEGATSIGDALKVNKKLVTLIIKNNNISDEGGASVVVGLKKVYRGSSTRLKNSDILQRFNNDEVTLSHADDTAGKTDEDS